jgi:hypothetical protein
MGLSVVLHISKPCSSHQGTVFFANSRTIGVDSKTMSSSFYTHIMHFQRLHIV